MVHRQALAPSGVIEPVGAWFCEKCKAPWLLPWRNELARQSGGVSRSVVADLATEEV